MAKDLYHDNVKAALIADGWHITDDPYAIRIDDVGDEIDFGAEPIIAAEKEEQSIAVEVKNFMGPSLVNEFHKAMGQFNDYTVALELSDPKRRLFLAIPELAWKRFFQKPIIQQSLQRIGARVIVYDPQNNIITQWIK